MQFQNRTFVIGCLCVALPSGAALAAAQGEAQNTSPSVKLARAVENELYHDAMLSLDDVNARVERGTVTLTGTVTSLLAKERAARVAETVKGVLDVRNEIVVAPQTQKSAEALSSAIRHALVMNPATEGYEIQVKAEPNGSVLLTGEVDSWAERDLAGRIAKGVGAVTAVRNDLEVSFQEGRSDSDLQAEIERLLRWDVYVDESNVDVRVRDRVVQLSGSVPSAAEKRRAVALAGVSGAKSIDAKGLTVQPEGKTASGGSSAGETSDPPTDAYIAQAVRSAVKSDPVADADELDVQVIGGVVTLYGSVRSLQAERAAVARAAATEGVIDVRNRIRVRGESTPKDEDIARNVIAALAASPITEAYKISVGARRGEVTLTGHVDNWFERGAADDVAAGVRGVREVNNRLTVTDSAQRLTFDPYVDTWSIYDYDWYTPAPVTTPRLDRAIIDEIEQELAWSPFVDANQVDVAVHQGVATLTGRVDSVAERQAAAENAFEGGAIAVDNQLQLKR